MYRPADVLEFAFDRASARITTDDGHMHVAATPISKAVINDYWGREIPDYERLGLQADQLYSLLRDPDELAKAAKSFNGKPILREHMPVTAGAYPQDLVIGTTGSDTDFDGDFLRNSISLWSGKDIDKVLANEKKELSAGYRYRADMTPGVYKGKPYHGVMRDIKGNHVAVVKEGRAGSDVVVQDSALTRLGDFFMSSVPMSNLFDAPVSRMFAQDDQQRDADGKFGSGGGSSKKSPKDRGGNLKDRSNEVLRSQVNSMLRLKNKPELSKTASRATMEGAYRSLSK